MQFNSNILMNLYIKAVGLLVLTASIIMLVYMVIVSLGTPSPLAFATEINMQIVKIDRIYCRF